MTAPKLKKRIKETIENRRYEIEKIMEQTGANELISYQKGYLDCLENVIDLLEA